MVYLNKFIVIVKCNGKILRERDEFVTLPFGCEYSVLIKNLNSRRVSLKISIDGADVLDGQSLIVDGNAATEVEGFLSGDVAKNKFKFIQKTEKVQNHRGDKIDDGVIRVEFAYEKEKPIRQTVITDYQDHHHGHHHHSYWYDYSPRWHYTASSTVRASSAVKTTYTLASANNDCNALPMVDEGITVKGSEVHQQFSQGYIGELEPYSVVILRLRGENSNGTAVKKPIAVKTKLECPTCGTKSKSSVKYCGDCGTFLE